MQIYRSVARGRESRNISMFAPQKDQHYTYADYYAWDDEDTAPVQILDGCEIDLSKVFED